MTTPEKSSYKISSRVEITQAAWEVLHFCNPSFPVLLIKYDITTASHWLNAWKLCLKTFILYTQNMAFPLDGRDFCAVKII